MKMIKECPILCGVVAIAIILSAVSFAFMGTAYGRYSDPVKEGKAPLMTMFFKGVSEGVYPWSGEAGDASGMPAGEAPGQNSAEEGMSPDESIDAAGQGEEAAAVEKAETAQAASSDTAEDSAPAAGENADAVAEEAAEVPEEPKIYEFTEVDDDYFTDALFIGDSRTVGLSEYCEPLDTRATFYSKISLTIYDVLTKKFIKTDEGRICIEDALAKEQYAKIYIMLGLNEIGTGNPEYFKNAYEQVITRIRELQPDAIIFIQGIMHVTEDKSRSDQYFNNENINARNAVLAELADQSTVFYLDMNAAVDDENGNLAKELSFDDIHLKAASYQRWYEFLLHNGIVR
jgi:TATA-box binding protein (TBP) (component of TFIID and TFIIIB)